MENSWVGFFIGTKHMIVNGKHDNHVKYRYVLFSLPDETQNQTTPQKTPCVDKKGAAKKM
eukprot:snap_masked-scaffold_17-processed-gene-2.34-mRNA-1 protein AED:1.00 eAED:1.00 QI:0/0/0/0/1/1/3/0/59